MRKEVLIAIIIGFGLGLIITFGIWTANKALKETAPEEITPPEETVVEPSPSPLPAIELVITSPQDNALTDEDTIEIVGQTSPKAVVAVTYPDGEKLFEADEAGNFSTEITLVGGDNLVEIKAFNDQGDEAVKTLNIVYSTAEI